MTGVPLSTCAEAIVKRSCLVLSWLALTLAAGGWPCRGAEPIPTVDPLVYLFDGPGNLCHSATRAGPGKAAGSGSLEEDDLHPPLRRLPVLMNDKIVAVLHKDSPEVDVYSRQISGSEVVRDLAADLRRQAPSSVAQRLRFARTAAARRRSRSSSRRRRSSRGGSPTNSAPGRRLSRRRPARASSACG